MTDPSVTLDTLSLLLEVLLRQQCAERSTDFNTIRAALFSNSLNKDALLDKQAFELEEWLRHQCALLDVDYAEVRGAMFLRWFENRTDTVGDPLRKLLDRAFACRQRGDAAGYRKASLAWLKQAHDLEIGDLVRLGQKRESRVVRIENFSIAVNSLTLGTSTISFFGPCISDVTGTSSERWQWLTDSVEKVQKPEDQQ